MKRAAAVATLGDRLDELAAYVKSLSSRGRLAMLVYAPPLERRLVGQMTAFISLLEQTGLRVHVIDINHEVNSVLSARLDDVVEAWPHERAEAKRAIAGQAVPAIVSATLSANTAGCDVILWSRVGGAYPFLSVASLMENVTGKLDATLAVFYPGSLDGKTRLRLLDERDGYQYRADFLRTVDE